MGKTKSPDVQRMHLITRSGGLKMIDHENMIKALSLSWLKRIMDVECSGFWKLYLDYLFSKQGGLFIFQCNYDVNQIDIPSTFYNELLSWWLDLRESADPERGYKFILWNNKDILIEDKTVFYRHYFNNGVIFTKDLLFDKTNTKSFNEMKK